MKEKNNVINLKQANENFQSVIGLVEEVGSVVLQKDNQPLYVISKIQNKSHEEILTVASDIFEKHKHAFEVLGNE